MEAFTTSIVYFFIGLALAFAWIVLSDDVPAARMRDRLDQTIGRVKAWAGSLFGAHESVRAEMAEAQRRVRYPMAATDENATKAMKDGGRCFHCGEKDIWLAGPSGGLSQNLRCMNCGQGVNHLGPLCTDVLPAEYIMRAAYEQSGRVRADRRNFPYVNAIAYPPAVDPAIVQACLEAPIVLEPEEILERDRRQAEAQARANLARPVKGQRALDL